MVVEVEKSRGSVAILYWGDGQTKNDLPADIFIPGQENPLAKGEKALDIFS